MSNRWTGNYDAALAISNAALDRVLATQHASGSFFHGKWLPLPFDGGDEPDRVRGTLGVSLAPPRVEVEKDATHALTTTLDVRGYLRRHPESPPAPESFHGTLRVSARFGWFDDGGEALLQVRMRSRGTEVDFDPADGTRLSRRHRQLLEEEVRGFLRRHIGTVEQRFRLPQRLGVAGSTPRLWGGGGAPAGAGLLLDFETGNGGVSHDGDDALAPDNPFDGAPGDLVLALGRELIANVVHDAAAEALDGFEHTHTETTPLADFTFVTTVDADSVTASLEDGGIRLSVRGDVRGAVDLRLSIAQSFSLSLEDGRVRVEPSGRASVELRHGVVPDFVLNRAERAIESRLAGPARTLAGRAEDTLGELLDVAPDYLSNLDLPTGTDRGMEVLPRAIRVDGDAVRVTADLALAAQPEPVVRFTAGWHRGDGGALEMELRAQPAWIPGGTIHRYRWSILQAADRQLRLLPERHDFVRRVPILTGAPFPLWPPVTWCLAVDGEQVNPASGGAPVPVSGSSACLAPLPADDPASPAPPLWVDVLGADGTVSGKEEPSAEEGEVGVVGRATVDLRPGGRYGVPVLIHLADPKLEAGALQDLLAALDKAVRAAEVPAMATVVLGDDQPTPNPRRPTPLAFARDPGGAWAEAHRLDPGDTVLLDTDGTVARRTQGKVEVRALAGVLAELAEKPALEERPLAPWALSATRVRQGEPAPEAMVPRFGRWVPLRKLRGQAVTLCFWTPRSEAATAALVRLLEGAREGGPLVVAVHPAGDDALVKETLAAHGRRESSVPDRGAAARAFGVRLWPTTVHVDRRGRVARLGYGGPPVTG